MIPKFVSSDDSIPASSTTATTSIDYHSPIAVNVLVSVVALFLLCSVVVFVQRCFVNRGHHEQTTTTTVHTGARSGFSAAAPLPPGLDSAAVAALPVVRYTGGGGGCGSEGCAVCLVEYVGNERVKVIPGCGHRFHPECIDKWLLWRGSCPVCRCSEIWEVCVGVVGCGERNVGKLRRNCSCGHCCSELEAGGRGGGEMLLRRTCSV